MSRIRHRYLQAAAAPTLTTVTEGAGDCSERSYSSRGAAAGPNDAPPEPCAPPKRSSLSIPWSVWMRRRFVTWFYLLLGLLVLLLLAMAQLWRHSHTRVPEHERTTVQQHLLVVPAANVQQPDTEAQLRKMEAKRQLIRQWEQEAMMSKLRGGRTYKDGGRNWCTIPELQPRSLFPVVQSGCPIEISDESEAHNISHCAFGAVRFHPDQLFFAARGGEPLADVMGQEAAAEYVTWKGPGALTVYRTATTDPRRADHHGTLVSPTEHQYYIHDIVQQLDVSPHPWTSSQHCAPSMTSRSTATLFVQRDEYANLYHTLTDLWNTWEVYRQLQWSQQDHASMSVVFLDAHPAGLLDDVWTTLFGTVHRLYELLHTKGITCFTSAYFIPSGYVSRLGQVEQCKDPTVMDEFVTFVLTRYAVSAVRPIPGRVTLIDRRDFVAHPRHDVTTNDTRDIDNWAAVSAWIAQQIPSVTSVRIVPLHTMSFREQLVAIRESEVLIGNHGAGLTHLVFLDAGAHVVEFQYQGRDVFRLLHRWKDQIHHETLPSVERTISFEFFERHLLPVLRRIYPGDATPKDRDPTVHVRTRQEERVVPHLDVMEHSEPLARDQHAVCNIPFHSQTNYVIEHACSVEQVHVRHDAIHRCSFQKLRIDRNKITTPHIKGKRSVVYQPGTFVTPQTVNIAPGIPSERSFFLKDVLANLKTERPNEWKKACPVIVPGSTLFVHRYVSNSLHHTLLDVWNTWEVYRRLGSDSVSSVVALDAQAEGECDEIWTKLFGKLERVSSLRGTCFESAVMIPPGYSCRLGDPAQCAEPVVMDEFVNFVLDKYYLIPVHKVVGRVTIIDETMPGKPKDNLDHFSTWIQHRVSGVTSVTVLPVHNMTFRDQVLAIRESDVLIGRSSGLAHVLFLSTDTHFIEFQVVGQDIVAQDLYRWKSRVTHTVLQPTEHVLSPEWFENHLLPTLLHIFPETSVV